MHGWHFLQNGSIYGTDFLTLLSLLHLFGLEAHDSQAGAHYSGQNIDSHCNLRLLLPHYA